MSCLGQVFTRRPAGPTPKGPQPWASKAAGTTSGRPSRGQKAPAADSPRKSDELDMDLDGGRSQASTKASSSWPSSTSGPGTDSQCLAGYDSVLFAQCKQRGRPCSVTEDIVAGEAEPRFWALDDFSIVSTVGSGFIGSVRLVKRSSGGDRTPFALKVMKKREVLRKKQVVHAMQEKDLLGRVDHPFIVKLMGSFQDEANLYMVMEFVNGGELFSVVRSGKRFKNDDATFYAAEIMLALGHIHSKSIAYRDLKLENVLLDSCGHAKLVDFGFAKVVRTRTYTMCGTPDYLAPEIINREGHDHRVDWWALGVLSYEMLSGDTPFQGANAQAIYQKALMTEPKFPSSFSADAQSAISGLLVKSKSRRLGAGSNGTEDVKAHPWFNAVEWDMLLQRRCKAPFLPHVTCSDDASMFKEYKEEAISTKSTGLSESEQQQFEGF